jgi:Type II secretion system (T2SS), protein G
MRLRSVALASWLALSVSAVQAVAAGDPPKLAEPSAKPPTFIRSTSRDGFAAFETGVRSYRRSDGTGPTVNLVGVVHIGDKAYYDRLVEVLGASEIVLYESVLPRGAFGTGGANDLARQRSTQDAMLFVRKLMSDFARNNGELPATLADLRTFVVGRDTRLARPVDLALVDGWGRPLSYHRSGPMEFRLASLGADGVSGGRDFNLDLVLAVLSDAESGLVAEGKSKKEVRRDLYGDLASALDTSLQVRSIDYDKANWLPADLPFEELLDRLWKRGERSATLEMLSDEDGLAQGIVRFLLSIVSKSPEFKKLVIETLGKSGEMSSRKGGGGLGEVDRRIILDERNEAVIERLRAMLAAPTAPGSVAIFYGAAHMGDFDATLRSEFGLERGDVRWFRAMYADEWSRKKIEARIKKLEGEIAALPATEQATDAAAEATAGAPGSGKRALLEERVAELRERLAALPDDKTADKAKSAPQ